MAGLQDEVVFPLEMDIPVFVLCLSALSLMRLSRTLCPALPGVGFCSSNEHDDICSVGSVIYKRSQANILP